MAKSSTLSRSKTKPKIPKHRLGEWVAVDQWGTPVVLKNSTVVPKLSTKETWPKCDLLREYFDCGFKVLGSFTDGFALLIDKGKWPSKILLATSIWMTWVASKWSFEYTIAQANADGLATAAIIGAVVAPIAALTAAVFRFFLTASTDSKRIDAGQDAPQQVSVAATATSKGAT